MPLSTGIQRITEGVGVLAEHLGVLLPGILTGGGVTPLPKPPPLERYLFEQPLPSMILLGVVALVAVVVFQRRAQLRTGLIVAGGCLLLAGGAYALSRAVVTEREVLQRESLRLVRAVAEADTKYLERILHPEVDLVANRQFWGNLGRHGIISRVNALLRNAELRAAVLDNQAVLDGPNVGRTQLRVRVQDPNYMDLAWWRVDWRREPGGFWRVVRIERLTSLLDRS